LSELQIDEIANQKTIELEKTTPHLVTWQDWSWPRVVGDYCKFIGYGSRPFYNSLATKATGEQLFKNSFYFNLMDDSDIYGPLITTDYQNYIIFLFNTLALNSTTIIFHPAV
tara:strand:- start:1529 stop:1864 length:336 start_codon:yes stop_codon:yes gene_type:complete